jgi:hypothetical protein
MMTLRRRYGRERGAIAAANAALSLRNWRGVQALSASLGCDTRAGGAALTIMGLIIIRTG